MVIHASHGPHGQGLQASVKPMSCHDGAWIVCIDTGASESMKEQEEAAHTIYRKDLSDLSPQLAYFEVLPVGYLCRD